MTALSVRSRSASQPESSAGPAGWPEVQVCELDRELVHAQGTVRLRALDDPAALARAARLVRTALARKHARDQGDNSDA
jgi:hypothetical protein